MSTYQGLYDPVSSSLPPTPDPNNPSSSYSFSAIPLSPGLPTHPIAPDARAYLPSRQDSRPSPLDSFRRRSSFSRHHHPISTGAGTSKERSLIDEILPAPTGHAESGPGGINVVFRRTGSVAVIVIFILVASWLAVTDEGGKMLGEGARGLRHVFGTKGTGEADWVVQGSAQQDGGLLNEQEEVLKKPSNQPDFDQYLMLRTVPANLVELSGHGRRVIFIGDVHGSYIPLRKLMDKISYSPSTDTLIHVGDLVAKGERSIDVLNWFEENRVLGIRGNHDQPVIQWRAWMEWAGGDAWEGLVRELEPGNEGEVVQQVEAMGKSWPKDWEWKGEHWHIAKKLSKQQYSYLLQLPLTLHIPSLHSIIVHAGLLPSNPLRDPNHSSQPLIAADALASEEQSQNKHEEIRNTEEISILADIPQNQKPWNLINMRGLYEKGKNKGTTTKSSKKGTPWSEVWAREMKRCNGPGAFARADSVRDVDAKLDERDGESEEKEPMEDDEDVDKLAADLEAGGADAERLKKLKCSPVTVIYGHAASRGLDIKPFSKGRNLLNRCLTAQYGRQLTVLVMGELAGLKGESVRVGDHRGILVSVPCKTGGL